MASKKISALPSKTTLVNADEFTILDSAEDDVALKNKRISKANALLGVTQDPSAAGNNLRNQGNWVAAGGAAVLNVGTAAGTVAAGDAPAAAVTTHEGTYAHANLPTTAQKAALDAATTLSSADAVVAASVMASAISAAGHAAVTVADTATVNLSLTGQQVSADVLSQMSVTSDASGLKLSGDAATPGNTKLYGTDGAGTKGWYSQPGALPPTATKAEVEAGTVSDLRSVSPLLMRQGEDARFASPPAIGSTTPAAGAFTQVLVRNGVTATVAQVNNTYTDASNYERFAIDWQTSANVCRIGTEAAGTGSARELEFIGASFRFPADTSPIYLGSTGTNSIRAIGGQGTVFTDGVGQRLQIGNTMGLINAYSGNYHLCELQNYSYPALGSVLRAWKPNYDAVAQKLEIKGGSAFDTATTNISGAELALSGGDGALNSSGNANGGNLVLSGGTPHGTGVIGYVSIQQATGALSFYGATPVVQPAGAGQAAVTLGNADSEIGGLTISAAYDQTEVQALRDKCEELGDDVRALSTLVHALRTALVNLGAIKGAA